MEGYIRRQHCIFHLKSWPYPSPELAVEQTHHAYHAQVIFRLSPKSGHSTVNRGIHWNHFALLASVLICITDAIQQRTITTISEGRLLTAEKQ